MGFKYLSLCTVIIFLLAACGGSGQQAETPVKQAGNTELTHFAFLKLYNPSLDSDVILSINSGIVSTRLTTNVALNSLVATFEHEEGTTVSINGVTQASSVTTNNFKQVVTYRLTTDDGRVTEYQVDLVQFTGLPIIYVATENWVEIDSKDDYVKGTVSIQGGREFTDLADTKMKIRGRGNSTWKHPKKPYQMKLNDKTEFLGMPEGKKWLFLAEYSDKTLLRNTIAFEMGHISQLDWTPKSTFAEVYLNDSYNGTYNITEKIEESDQRVAIGDTGYLLEVDQLDRLDPNDIFFRTSNFLLNIKAPDVEQNSSEYNYIKTHLNEFEDVLMGSQYKDPTHGYEKYIDVESFIDWYLISEITKNIDSRSFSSIYLNLIPGKKIKMGPLWDFDLSFGNIDYADSRYAEGFWVKDHVWYTRLFQDPEFVEKIKIRFAYFKQNQQFILDKIDSEAQKLQWAQQENDNKWQTIGRYVWPNSVVFDTYGEEVEHLKSWHIDRMNWLDTAYNNM